MTRFENKLCPVCRSRFNDKADIVVCPVCGTPHHRACYSINNKCALEGMHEKGWNWNGLLPDEEEERAVSERRELDAAAAAAIDPEPSDPHHAEYPGGVPYQQEQRMFEEKLGPDNPFAELFKTMNDKEIGADGVSMHELVAYSATSVYHYGKAFNMFRGKVDGKKHKVFFNFCSGLFAPAFQFYRRMNFFGIATLLVTLIPSLVAVLIPQDTPEATLYQISYALDLLRLLLMILLCMFSDYLYYRHCVRRIVKIRSSYDGDTKSDDYFMALYEQGRPTFAGGLVGCLGLAFGYACLLALSKSAIG